MANQNYLSLLPFGKRWDTGEESIISIIIGDNPAGHCFLLMDLMLMNFFKYFMIVKLKMCITSRIFGI